MISAFVAFVMLGIIPGTTIQITFRDWVFAVLAASLTVILVIRVRSLIGQLVAHAHATSDHTVAA